LDHRVFYPILCVDVLAARRPFGAERPLVGGMLGHPFHVDQISVLYMSIDAAMAVGIADRTESFQDRHLDTSIIDI